ncbi:hypothetical protein [Microbacterium radiodurans]|uniref:Uncharacterized protein n=1 Tax=Microbacterium radiodurans TaxID=661398 RepID=A0A5J5IPV2_9MICO|nr:hypothetical protein [Microbacterium radiodurans]KAA9083737.1 hypothetical protein F6B42_14390 [Microbacterium radiodurans]
MARTRLAQFVACRDRHVDALALLTEAALHDAIADGVSIDRLAAELDLSPQTLASILTRDTTLRELHPVRAGA